MKAGHVSNHMICDYSWPLNNVGIRNHDLLVVKTPHITFDSTVCPSRHWIQLTADGEKYFGSAVENQTLGM